MEKNLKIYAVMSVKDEQDVIYDCIRMNLKWADKIFIVDNNCSDSTLSIIDQFDKDRVIVLAKFFGHFEEGLKSIPFNWVNSSKSIPKPDWWVVLDADEFYYDDPKVFLKSVPDHCSRVCTNCIEFIGLIDDNNPLNIESYSYYVPLLWSESRFYRNIRGLSWSNWGDNGPSGVGAVHKKRIKILHFPFRTSEQIERRLKIRKSNISDSGIAWSNSRFSDAEDLLSNYNANSITSISEGISFRRDSINFLVGGKQKLVRLLKIVMFYFGFYRAR